jgi:cellulose synthase/poly-beta-1,6-N-acetylglucosamine synthase-like glycosyltransferase
MKVSIVIPCYHKKKTIEKIVEAVRNAPLERREITVVDDCSQDGTRTVLEKSLSHVVYRIIYRPVNRGKEAALRSGFAAATGDIILVQDADLEHNREVCPALLEPLMSGKADAIFRSGFMDGRPHRVLFFWHMVGNKFLRLRSRLSNQFRLKKTGLTLSPKLPPNLPAQAVEFMRSVSRTAGGLMQRERRSTGRMA